MAVRSKEREQMLADIIITAAEDGGSNSWRQVIDYHWSDENPAETYVEVVDVEDDEDGSTPTFKFDIDAAARGLKLIAAGGMANSIITKICRESDRDNECQLDAYDADMVLQAAWFGELVYG